MLSLENKKNQYIHDTDIHFSTSDPISHTLFVVPTLFLYSRILNGYRKILYVKILVDWASKVTLTKTFLIV